MAIARALAYEPRLLLLDEITSALDPELVGEVLTLVGELAAAGRTIVMATHEMAFAREVADTVCFLDGGRIVESGSAAAGFDRSARGPHPPVPAALHRRSLRPRLVQSEDDGVAVMVTGGRGRVVDRVVQRDHADVGCLAGEDEPGGQCGASHVGRHV